MRSNIVSFMAGLLFAFGLGISGMTQPANIVGFLDIFGSWNPTLVFVMASAVGIYFAMFQWAQQRKKPVYAPQFGLPKQTQVDRSLLTGSALFGIGWGIGGLCPGPALVSIFTGTSQIVIFVGCMVVGMYLGGFLQNKKTRSHLTFFFESFL